MAIIICQRQVSSLRVIDHYSGQLRQRDYVISELSLPPWYSGAAP
jgi:hypothetical protein